MTSSSGCQPNSAALNRGRHLYSAGRPSRLALAHISSFVNVNVWLQTCNSAVYYMGMLYLHNDIFLTDCDRLRLVKSIHLKMKSGVLRCWPPCGVCGCAMNGQIIHSLVPRSTSSRGDRGTVEHFRVWHPVNTGGVQYSGFLNFLHSDIL